MTGGGGVLDPAQVSARLRAASALADLDPARRIEGKVSLDPAAVSARLREASELALLCESLVRAGRQVRESARSR